MCFSEKQVKAHGKRKEEVFFLMDGNRPITFVNCSMEFLLGQKMQLIFWIVCQRRTLQYDVIISFKIHATDFVLECSHTLALKK